VSRLFKRKPSRLELVRSNAPVYFVTFNSHTRASLLARPEVHEAFVEYCRRATDFRIGVGRYVLMPDHIHLFVRFGIGCTTTLGVWIKGLKRDLGRVLLSMESKPLQFAGQKLSSFLATRI
jgi:putative transposase